MDIDLETSVIMDEFGADLLGKKTGRQVVVNPSLDLDSYISNYSGHAKINRLEFIADVCPELQTDALQMALAELKTTYNVPKYSALLGRLNEILSSRARANVAQDSAWVESTNRAVRIQTEKLETELKNYKNNLIKESIRMGHQDLGDHFYKAGELTNALKCYSRTRDYCTTSKHIVEMCLNVIKVSLELSNFSHVQSYVAKAEATPDVPDKNLVFGKLRCCAGLAYLDSKSYKAAARNFLDVPFELGNSFSEVLSANDVATYGGLCALASYDRADLKTKVMENSAFKQYLELEPQIREIIYSFYASKYGHCLELFSRIKNDLLLDPYLHAHVDSIYGNIRRKALIQYFSPFLSVDINKMAAAFNTTVAELEPELAMLIIDNQVQARIDSHNKVLHVKKADQRSTVFEKSHQVGAEYLKESRQLLLTASLIRQDMLVTPDH
ncbi:hypothetical protein HDU76_000759 [Blyttiomyces sp. JEL0837]|nr:hypothetical protein HDU76_000759 [Blyttiomyces sp. JEL0837]